MSYTRRNLVLLGFTGFDRVLPSFTEFYWVSVGSHLVEQSFHGFERDSFVCIELDWVFTGLYWVLLGFSSTFT